MFAALQSCQDSERMEAWCPDFLQLTSFSFPILSQQMERFKAIEKEMKTKAYSREGLIMSGRLDPKEKEKAELCSWITDRVEALTIQIEAREAEVETLLGGKKAKGNQAKEKVSQLGQKIERHKWHQGRLELIMRLLENGQIDTEKVCAGPVVDDQDNLSSSHSLNLWHSSN